MTFSSISSCLAAEALSPSSVRLRWAAGIATLLPYFLATLTLAPRRAAETPKGTSVLQRQLYVRILRIAELFQQSSCRRSTALGVVVSASARQARIHAPMVHRSSHKNLFTAASMNGLTSDGSSGSGSERRTTWARKGEATASQN